MSNSNDQNSGSQFPSANAGNSSSSNNDNSNFDVEHSMQVDADITDFVRSYRNEQDDRLKKNEVLGHSVGRQISSTDKRCAMPVYLP